MGGRREVRDANREGLPRSICRIAQVFRINPGGMNASYHHTYTSIHSDEQCPLRAGELEMVLMGATITPYSID